jgi:hypothetical protein
MSQCFVTRAGRGIRPVQSSIRVGTKTAPTLRGLKYAASPSRTVPGFRSPVSRHPARTVSGFACKSRAVRVTERARRANPAGKPTTRIHDSQVTI